MVKENLCQAVRPTLVAVPSTRAAFAAAWSLALFLVRVGMDPCLDNRLFFCTLFITCPRSEKHYVYNDRVN